MKSDFLIALTQLAAERHLPKEQVLQAIEVALASAFKRDNPAGGQNITVRLNPNTGDINVFALKTVVDLVEDPTREIGVKEAQAIKKNAVVGDEVTESEALPHNASRIAAQTAKQVVLQRLREAEREKLFDEFVQHKDDIISGVIEQIAPGRPMTLELGRAQAMMPVAEQVPTERYKKGQRIKVFVLDVRNGAKGPEILVSRSHKDMLKRLFEIEVPEVYNGVVEIQAIARSAGFRSKVAVNSTQEGIDPVGSCIGVRGNRIQSIVNELQGENIDVIPWDKDPKSFIAKALSPSEVVNVDLYPEDQSAMVVVPDRQLSLAIGKEGQNARLAARLTGWRLDIKGVAEWEEIKQSQEQDRRLAAAQAAENVGFAEEPEPEPLESEPPVEVATVVEATSLEIEVAATEVTAVVPEIPEAVTQVDEEAILEALIREEEESLELAPVEAGAGLSVEELASFTLDDVEETAYDDEDEEDEELPENLDGGPDMPVLTPDAGKIRFAEDIVGDFRGSGRGGRRRSGGAARGGARRGGGR